MANSDTYSACASPGIEKPSEPGEVQLIGNFLSRPEAAMKLAPEKGQQLFFGQRLPVDFKFGLSRSNTLGSVEGGIPKLTVKTAHRPHVGRTSTNKKRVGFFGIGEKSILHFPEGRPPQGNREGG